METAINSHKVSFEDFHEVPDLKFDIERLRADLEKILEEKKFNSDNLDLLFKNNKAIIYNNVKYFDNKIVSTADEIELDFIKGDINIKMFDKNKKVEILKK